MASRNYYSTLAYQGYGEGIDKDLIVNLTRAATDEQYMTPDLAMVLSLDDEQERLSRINSRGELENPDTFEVKTADSKTAYAWRTPKLPPNTARQCYQRRSLSATSPTISRAFNLL